MGGSSRRNRKHGGRKRSPGRHGGGRSSKATTVGTGEHNFEQHQITGGVGYDLLMRVGWGGPGHSLGASPARTATTPAPVPIVVRTPRAGLGCSPVSPPAHGPAAQQDNAFYTDPLSPRCRFDSTHVCASLKALQKHEATCPCNPANVRRSGMAQSAPAAGAAHWMQHLQLQSDQEDDDDDLSDLSDLSEFSDSDEEDDDGICVPCAVPMRLRTAN